MNIQRAGTIKKNTFIYSFDLKRVYMNLMSYIFPNHLFGQKDILFFQQFSCFFFQRLIISFGNLVAAYICFGKPTVLLFLKSRLLLFRQNVHNNRTSKGATIFTRRENKYQFNIMLYYSLFVLCTTNKG